MSSNSTQSIPTGKLVISLDFELNWGVRDKPGLDYKENILGARIAIPRILQLFERYEIHATWATVGFLFFESRDELLSSLPSKLPQYTSINLSPYNDLCNIGESEIDDPMHFGLSLIRLIEQTPNQEIGSHTFSHYYCLEEGQDKQTFEADIEATISIAMKRGIKLESIVFPRNQFNEEYMDMLFVKGFKQFRGTENVFFNLPLRDDQQSQVNRALRLVDSYLPISGHNCYDPNSIRNLPLNIASSRFLRPYNTRLSYLEPLRLRRILSDMSYAAKERLFYHMWWHPHNFGKCLDQNLEFLDSILKHYKELHMSFGMASSTMSEVARSVRESPTES